MVAAAAAAAASTTCMLIHGGGSGYPPKSMEVQWIRSRRIRKAVIPNPDSREFGSIKSKPPPSKMPIYISTDPSHVNLQELSELYSSCNYACNRFPVVDPNTGIVEEAMELGKLRIALSHSSVVVSVFCKPEHVNLSDTTSKQFQNQEEQQRQMNRGFLGDLRERMMPVNPSDSQLVGFGRAVSDMGLTATIYDVMVIPSLQGMGIGTIIVKRIIRTLTSGDIYDIAAVCSKKERFFFKACEFRDNDILGATTMMYTRTVSDSFGGDQMVKQVGSKLLVAPPPREPFGSPTTAKPQS